MNKDQYKDFENQGWDAMFQTLDREMPVKKKRRGLLWLWWGVCILSVGSAFLYYKTTKNTPLVQNAVSKPIVNQKPIDVQTDTFVQKKVIIQGPNAFIQIKNNETGRKFSELLNSKVPTRDKIIQTTHSDFLKQDTASQVASNIVLEESSKMITSENNFKKANDIAIEKSDLLEEIAVVTNLKTIDAIDFIKTGPLSITQDSNLKLDIKPLLKTIICPAKSPKKLNWGITVGAHTQGIPPSVGFQAGLSVSKSLSPKWSFASGLSFRQTKMPSQNTAYLSASADRVNAASSSTILQKATSISIDKLYYVEMPLSLERMFAKKIAFTMGFKPSYLLGQSIKKSDLAVYWVNNSSFSTSKELLNNVNATSLGLKRWDLACMGGITYLPVRHIQLGLRYDLGIVNIFSRNNNSAYNRYIGLNLNYQF